MLSRGRNPEARRSLWRVLGFLCCALIVCAGIAQVGHIHPGGPSTYADCALCHTVHVAVQPVIPHALAPAVWIAGELTAAVGRLQLRNDYRYSLFSRPPPVDVAFT
jgi:hypothetical protein